MKTLDSLKNYEFTTNYSTNEQCWIARYSNDDAITDLKGTGKTPEEAITELQSHIRSTVVTHRNPAEIISIMHSFTDMFVECNGELCVKQTGDKVFSSIRSFEPGSFTRRLLLFIENYLNENQNQYEQT